MISVLFFMNYLNIVPLQERFSILALVLTLAFPAGVLAQIDDQFTGGATSDVEATATFDEGEEGEFANELGVNDSESVSVDPPTALRQERATPTDTYRRESLHTDEVFGDFIVGPGRFELEMGPGDTRVVEMTLTNRMGEGRYFSFATEDTIGLADGSSAIQLLGDQVGPYTLRDFISVPHERFYLEHATRVRIPITVSIPADAEPGGRYGSLLTSVTIPPGELADGSGARTGSAVISRIGTLFFIRTPGEISQELQLIDFTTRNAQRIFASGPIAFDVVHDNAGTVHATPYGRITIRNIFGEEVGIRNITPWFVMPDSVRTREVTWEREFLIGRYTATAEINRGYDDVIDELTYSFWVIPWKLVAAVFGGLFFFFLLLRFFFSRFELKRK